MRRGIEIDDIRIDGHVVDVQRRSARDSGEAQVLVAGGAPERPRFDYGDTRIGVRCDVDRLLKRTSRKRNRDAGEGLEAGVACGEQSDALLGANASSTRPRTAAAITTPSRRGRPAGSRRSPGPGLRTFSDS